MTLTRSLLTILIPGFIAVAPWTFALMYLTSDTFDIAKYSAMSNALIFACAAVAGSLFEGAATNFEVKWDEALKSDFSVKENWYTYLSRTFEHEPVGYRYLSRLVTTMYFELSMMFAVPSFFLGVCLISMIRFPDHFVLLAIGALLGMVGSGMYLHKQAKCSHRVICETRKEINERTGSNQTVPAPIPGACVP